MKLICIKGYCLLVKHLIRACKKNNYLIQRIAELIFRPVRCPICGYAVEYCCCKGEDYKRSRELMGEK